MPRQKQAVLSWHVADDEQTWQQLTAPHADARTADSPHGASRQSSNTPNWYLSAIVSALVVLSLVGAYLYHQARTGLAQVESELATAVDTERWAASIGSQAVLEEALDPAAPDAWRSRILLEHEQIAAGTAGRLLPADARPLLFGDGVALVQVRERSTTGSVYVTHRFYRETEDGWVRTTPQPALWGPMRLHETRFFRFHFYERDTAAVETVADRIDDFYAGLREELGLPPPDGAEKLSVSVTVPDTPQFDMLSIYFMRGSLEVPSPELLPLLENATPAQALEQTIDQALIRDLFQRREVQLGVSRPWYPLVEAMRLWQLQQASHSATWYADRVRWLYTEWPAIHRDDRAPAAGEADWLCQVSTRGTPLIANWLLPGDCVDEEPAQLLRAMPLPPQHLDDLEMTPITRASEEHWVVRWQRRAILASVVDYGVATYGRPSLHRLLQAMTVHDRWETLIPAVYGVSVAEFEAGWQVYLQR